MTAPHYCLACGNSLPADAPAGLCPRCLLAGGFVTAALPQIADFEPPTVAELAPLFPNLEITRASRGRRHGGGLQGPAAPPRPARGPQGSAAEGRLRPSPSGSPARPGPWRS